MKVIVIDGAPGKVLTHGRIPSGTVTPVMVRMPAAQAQRLSGMIVGSKKLGCAGLISSVVSHLDSRNVTLYVRPDGAAVEVVRVASFLVMAGDPGAGSRPRDQADERSPRQVWVSPHLAIRLKACCIGISMNRALCALLEHGAHVLQASGRGLYVQTD